jgi:hypothetical protein
MTNKFLICFVFLLMFFSLNVGQTSAQENDTNYNDVNYLIDDYNISPEDLDILIEDYNISPEDLDTLMEDYNISPENIDTLMDEYDIDQENLNRLQNTGLTDLITSTLIIQGFHNNLDLVKELFNKEIADNMEDFVKTIYKNESYKLVLSTPEKDYNIFFDFDDIYLNNVSQNQIREKVNLTVFISSSFIDDVLLDADLLLEDDIEPILLKIQENFKNKNIYFKPHGIWGSIKYSALSIVQFLISI